MELVLQKDWADNMSNTSATGGYLKPTAQTLDVQQFIQSVLVGISGIQGNLVRPKWQPKEPIQPENTVNWIAFSVVDSPCDANAFVGMDSAGVETLQRQEYLTVNCSFYGPNCYNISGTVRDGFQIQQNLAALRSVNMGFIGVGIPNRTPDLTNEVWVPRVEMPIMLVRMIQRFYPILPLVGANGEIRTVLTDGENTIDWNVEQ